MKKKLLIGLFLLGSISLAACKPTPPVDENNTDEGDTMKKQAVERSYSDADEEYFVSSTETELKWYAKYLVGNKHEGTVKVSEGNFAVIDGVVRDGKATIDMTTITEKENNERFLGDIRGADFFDIEQFPQSSLEIKNISQPDASKEANYQITADLTIKGITNEITFPAVIVIEDGIMTANADFTIDRTKWGITFQSSSFFKDLGDKVIDDNIRYELIVKAYLIDEDGNVTMPSEAMMEKDVMTDDDQDDDDVMIDEDEGEMKEIK